MPNQDKLIKSGIKYTDAVFDEIIQRLSRGVKSTDTLEAFLEKTKDYTSSNPLQVSGYKDGLLKIILQETNSHKFSRPAQKELVRITIENRVGELIDNVGEDIKDSVRDIVRDGYNRNLSQDEIALNISNRVSAIKGKRARAIARTEIARTATVSDYVINRERGANGWYVECRNTACPVCKDRWHKSWTPESDESFKPSDTSAGGKGWIGDRIFSMNDTGRLPPVHPNCRCVVYYTSEEPNVSTEPVQQTTTTIATTTKPKTNEPKNILDNLTDDELKKYNKSQQIIEKNTKALEKLSSDDPRRIMFESRIKSAKRTIKKLEEIASNSSNRKVVEEILLQKGGKKNNNLDYAKINSNEELASYFGFTYIEERTSQYGKTSSRPIFRDEKHNVDITGMEMFDILETKEVLESYDKSHPFLKRATTSLHLDPSTDIRELGVCYTSSNSITIYSHKRDLDSNSIQSTVDHEMSHAFDNILGSEFDKYHSQESKEYRKIVREEGWSSLYSYSTKGSTRIAEDIAEAGSMVLNKNDPNVRIKMPDGEIITAKEWCKRFPKKTAYFEKLLESKEAKKLLGE